MNAIDGLFNFLADTLNKFANFIPEINLPFDKFNKWWSELMDIVSDVNSLFPLDDLFVIMGITVGFIIVFLTLWGLKFVKDCLSIF